MPAVMHLSNIGHWSVGSITIKLKAKGMMEVHERDVRQLNVLFHLHTRIGGFKLIIAPQISEATRPGCI